MKHGKHRSERFLTSFFMGAWLYSLILWGWVALNYYLLPVYQTAPFQSTFPFPRILWPTSLSPSLSSASWSGSIFERVTDNRTGFASVRVVVSLLRQEFFLILDWIIMP